MKRTPIVVRKASLADEAALALVYRAAFSAVPYQEKWTDVTARLRVRQMLKGSGVKGWTATLYGQPVGFAFLNIKQGYQGLYAELMETAVHPYLQRQGMGSLLVQEVLKYKRKAKFRTVYGVCLDLKLGSFFKKLGFKHSSRAQLWSKA